MRLHVDGAGRALVLTNRPVLLKGPGAVDGRLVGAGGLGNLVRGAVRGDGALVLRLRRRVVRAKVLDDVVLDERVAGPAVDGEVRVAVGVVLARVGDGALSVLVRAAMRYTCCSKRVAYRAVPGFQPFPPTRLPPVPQLTL